MPDLPKRKNTRLPAEAYVNGGYFFITICVHNRQQIFGKITDSAVQLSALGAMVREEIINLPAHFSAVEIIDMMIMPDHVHFIMRYHGENVHFGKAIGYMKSMVTKRAGHSLWQRNYHEHVIRSEDELLETLRYMKDNPLRWELKKKGLL